MVNRIAVVVFLVLAGFAGATLGQGSAVALADSGGGNSAAAVACQQGVYLNLIGTDGTTDVTFASTGQCVSYAAHGGQLASEDAAALCLNGGYTTLTSTPGQPAFPSEAACVLFVAQGGTPVAVKFFSVSITGQAGDFACNLQVTGSGLQPGATVYVTITSPFQAGPLAVFDFTSYPPHVMTVAPDGTLNGITEQYLGYRVTFTVTGASGDTVTSGSIAVIC